MHSQLFKRDVCQCLCVCILICIFRYTNIGILVMTHDILGVISQVEIFPTCEDFNTYRIKGVL